MQNLARRRYIPGASMKDDSRLLQVTQFLTLLGIGLRYDLSRRLGNLIDREDGIMEQRVAQLMSLRILERYGHRVDVEGAENVEDLEVRYCIVSNHLSYLDWVIHLAHCPRSPIFIAKREVTWYPVIGPYLRSRGLLIDRKAGVSARNAISDAAATQDLSWPLLIFPEGTRSRDGEMKPFRRGGLQKIAETGMPMVPYVILGSYECLPRLARTLRSNRRIKLVIGKPLFPADFGSPDELIDHMYREMKTLYDERRGEILDALPAPDPEPETADGVHAREG